MNAALLAELAFRVRCDQRSQLDLFPVQILTRQLRQAVELTPHGRVEPRVAVAEVDRRVPHLQVEVRAALGVEQEGALAAVEDLRRIGVVHRVAVRAVFVFQRQKLRFRPLASVLGNMDSVAVPPPHWLVHSTCPCSAALRSQPAYSFAARSSSPAVVATRASSHPARTPVASSKSSNPKWGRSRLRQCSSNAPLAST